MKVLQVNCVYQKGSTGKIVHDIHKCLLSSNIESVVCYGRGYRIDGVNVYKFCSELESKVYHLLNKFGWLMYAVCPIATLNLIRIIKKQRPDIVHIHCINGYCVNIYRLLKYLGKLRVKTIVTHHAEFYYTGSCGYAYGCNQFQTLQGCKCCSILQEATGTKILDRTNKSWRLMKQSFSYFRKEDIRFTAVSPWVVNRSLLSPICDSFECNWVTNGVDTKIFAPTSKEQISSIKKRLPNPDKKIILHVTASFTTAFNNIKGGYYIKKLAEMLPDYQFVIVATYLGEIKNIPDNICVWGPADSQEELASLYSSADLTVIASKRETFSMVVAESLCCGTPVAGFKAGGPESIAMIDCTNFVDYGNVFALKNVVEEMLSQNYDFKDISMRAHNKYSKESMTTGYIDLYRQMCHDK